MPDFFTHPWGLMYWSTFFVGFIIEIPLYEILDWCVFFVKIPKSEKLSLKADGEDGL